MSQTNNTTVSSTFSSNCTSIISSVSVSNTTLSSISNCNSLESNTSKDWKGFKVLHPLQILLNENAQSVHEDVVTKKEKIE
jgi:hypothetical protein